MTKVIRSETAIYFATEAFTTSGKTRLMGRHAAGEGFLKALARHGAGEEMCCFAAAQRDARSFADLLRAWGCDKKVRWVPHAQAGGLKEAGGLFVPGPDLGEMAWQRRRLGSGLYSISGVTHTISSHKAMDAIADLLVAPVMPWDALVCTSRAVADAAQRLMAAEAAYLKERLGATSLPSPTLALIPLGVDCEALAPGKADRAAWRGRLGIGPEDVAFLFFGRLSYHAKANPLPMYLALEQAAQASGRRIHLIQAGWFANEPIEREFRKGAAELCPSVNALFLDGREDEVRKSVWHAADVFISLSDNIQETFGLTPIEAMAAGLPSVVSDWDGYRDTVRDGVDGFCIPTVMPPPGLGADLAARHEDGLDSYDRYIGQASLFVGVDVAATREACTKLASDAGLRRRMGDSARARALEEFDWSRIVRRYEALWNELSARRQGQASGPARPGLAHPRRCDPYWLFSGYPTQAVGPQSRLTLEAGASPERLRELGGSGLLNFGMDLMATGEELEEAMRRIAASPGAHTQTLLESFPAASQPRLWRSLSWLAKLGLVKIAP